MRRIVEETLRSPRLLDRVRQALRVRHYSLRTEEACVAWIRRFILFHNKRHLPVVLTRDEVTRILARLEGPWWLMGILERKYPNAGREWA